MSEKSTESGRTPTGKAPKPTHVSASRKASGADAPSEPLKRVDLSERIGTIYDPKRALDDVVVLRNNARDFVVTIGARKKGEAVPRAFDSAAFVFEFVEAMTGQTTTYLSRTRGRKVSAIQRYGSPSAKPRPGRLRNIKVEFVGGREAAEQAPQDVLAIPEDSLLAATQALDNLSATIASELEEFDRRSADYREKLSGLLAQLKPVQGAA